MKTEIRNAAPRKHTYPKIMQAGVNEKLVVLFLDQTKSVVLSQGGSGYKAGTVIHEDITNNWKEFVGELVLSND